MQSAFLWALYLTGQFVHIVASAGLAVKDPHSSIGTYADYLRAKWPAMLVSFLLCTAGFLYWVEDPNAINGSLAKIGVQLPNLPLTHATAVIYGYFSDSLLGSVFGRVPVLQRDLPK